MKRRLAALALLLCGAGAHADDAAGVTIHGERDAALGLLLLPWKEEAPGDFDRPPAMQDPALQTQDAEGFARTQRYYQTGRAYRAERLQRNR